MVNAYSKEKDLENATKESVEDFVRQGEEKARRIASEAEKTFKQGQEQIKKLVSAADKQLHENPWPIVAGVAVSCLFLGFIMGSKKNS